MGAASGIAKRPGVCERCCATDGSNGAAAADGVAEVGRDEGFGLAFALGAEPNSMVSPHSGQAPPGGAVTVSNHSTPHEGQWQAALAGRPGNTEGTTPDAAVAEGSVFPPP